MRSTDLLPLMMLLPDITPVSANRWPFPQLSARMFRIKAGEEARSGRHQSALQGFDEALATDPGDRLALRGRVSALLALARFDEARAGVLELFSLGETFAAQLHLARLGTLTGYHLESARLLETTLARHHDCSLMERAEAVTLHAEVAENCGWFERAKERFEEALVLWPGQESLVLRYARFCIARDNFEKSLELLESIPVSDDSLLLQGIALRRGGNVDGVAFESVLLALNQSFLLPESQIDGFPAHRAAAFALWVMQRPQEALRLGTMAWAECRTPEMAEILLQAAREVGDSDLFRQWIEAVRRSGLRTPVLEAHLEGAETLSSPRGELSR